MESKNTYDVEIVEKKWQREWEERKSFSAKEADSRPRCYCLEMFPYPSGNLHMGHVRNYSIGDVVARYHRMKGGNVLHPIGWDAFGLPAENAAIKNKVPPEKWTRQNIAVMREQLKALGISYDWDREFATCDSDYYRWNQWFFIQFYKKGWVYKKKASVNWCPSCQTVLANEQVSAAGECWRCNSIVQLKELEQWFIKITDFADDLLKGHELLKGKWPDEVITMQQNWIGKSDGAEVVFPLQGRPEEITVFTTRPDTLFGATFMALAPKHPLAKDLAANMGKTAELDRLIKGQRERQRQRRETEDKSGFYLGVNATNPINQKPVPVWVADYVLMEYGTGAIMAVPAHDQRDFEFATKYKIPIQTVVIPAGRRPGSIMPSTTMMGPPPVTAGDDGNLAYEGEGIMVNSGEYDGLSSADGKRKVGDWLNIHGVGRPTVTYKLRDWLVSRQRYWGTPIPMIACATCGVEPVPEKDLPVLLPTDVQFTGTGESPLAQSASFMNVKCPKCGGAARRETDTMDTFVDSSWYYARYTDAHQNSKPFDSAKANPWLPVNQYIGGIEHATMHLIYSRFWHKAMKKLGFVQSEEPFERLLAQGMVTLGGSAMSKSRGNVVDPNAIIAKYGADTARLFILFAAPPEKQLEWNDDAVEGGWRFLNRVWRLVQNFITAPHPNPLPSGDRAHLNPYSAPSPGSLREGGVSPGEAEKSLLRKTHWAIDKVTRDYGGQGIQINTAIAAIMELVNVLYAEEGRLGAGVISAVIEKLALMLAPFAPYLAQEIWEESGRGGPVFRQCWPSYDAELAKADEAEIVVQVNGKLRSRIWAPFGTSPADLEALALVDEKVRPFLAGKRVAKVIAVPDKLVNIVVR